MTLYLGNTKISGIAIPRKTISVDSELSASSENPVQNKLITNALSNKLDNSDYVVDSTLNSTSEHPVQNKILYPSLSNFIPAGTILTVKTDGTGNFIKLSDAINYLIDKWSNGTIILQLGNGTFNEYNTINIGTLNNTPFNIPLLEIKGNGVSNTILQWNFTDQSGTTLFITTKVYIHDLTIKNIQYSNNIYYWGVQTARMGHTIIVNCNTENLSNGITSMEGGRVILGGNISIIKTLSSAIVSQYGGQLIVMNGTTFTISNSYMGFAVWNGGYMQLANNSVTYNSVTNKTSQEVGVFTNNGIIFGITV